MYRIYKVDVNDIDRFDTSYQEIKDLAEDFYFDDNLEELLRFFLKLANDGDLEIENCYYFLCDEENGIVLQG